MDLQEGVQTCNLARGTDSVRDMEWVEEEILDTISDADSSIDDLSCDLFLTVIPLFWRSSGNCFGSSGKS